MLKELYGEDGISSLMTGGRQRVLKVMLSCAGVLTCYEFFNNFLQRHHILE